MDTTNVEAQTPIISLTDAALKEVKRLINVQGIEEGGLRLGAQAHQAVVRAHAPEQGDGRDDPGQERGGGLHE